MGTPTTEKQGKSPLPPYIAFKTLIDVIERMEREGPPTRVDPTYLESYAGGYRPTVISNLHTMGLLTPTNAPSPELLALVAADESQRKTLIGDLIKKLYADVFSLGLNSTQGQFLEWFSAQGVQGDTRRKAVSFFLKACTFAGVAVGTHWKTPAAGSSGTRRKPTARKADSVEMDGDDEDLGGNDREDVATVRLDGGVTVTLAVDGSVLTMPRADRTFLFDLIDKMQDYERDHGADAPVGSDDAQEEAVQ